MRLTKDTNIVCAGRQGTKVFDQPGRAKEQQEIPPAPPMQLQENQGKLSGGVVMPQETQAESGGLSKNPSKLTRCGRNNRPETNEDVAKGSGFVVGGKESCSLKVGDTVKVEPSDMRPPDMRTATPLHLLAAQDSGDSQKRR